MMKTKIITLIINIQSSYNNSSNKKITITIRTMIPMIRNNNYNIHNSNKIIIIIIMTLVIIRYE